MRNSLRLALLCAVFILTNSLTAFSQTAAFTVSESSGCAPLTVNFTDQSTGTVTGWNWNLGNSTTPTTQNPSTTYTTPGTYVVTLSVTGPGGTSAPVSKNIIVYDKPAVSISASTIAGCNPLTVNFSSSITPNSPGTLSTSWDFDDGNAGTGTNTNHTFYTAGTYKPTLKVTNGAGCGPTFSAPVTITVYPLPTASFTNSSTTPISVCSVPSTVTFINSSTGGTTPYSNYSWDYGDGSPAGSGSPSSHTYTTGGAYPVKLTVTDAHGCTDTKSSLTVTVNTAVPTFSGKTTLCKSELASFTNTTAGSSNTSWDFGDGYTVSNSTSATHFYANAGSYTVVMSTTIGGCTKTVSKLVTINPEPTVSFTYNPAIPCPASVQVNFTATSSISGSTFVWKDKNGVTVYTGNPYLKTYNANIEDELTVIATSGAGCSGSFTDPSIMIRGIVVEIVPSGGDNPPLGLCVNELTPFYVNVLSTLPVGNPLTNYPATTTSWLWDFGDGSPTSTSANPSHTYSAVGNYKIKCVITTANGCKDSSTIDAHADTKVHPSFYASPLVECTNKPITFYNTTSTTFSGITYTWALSEASFSKNNTAPFTYSYLAPGFYDITLFADHNGCIDFEKKQAYIEIHPPQAKFLYQSDCSSLKVNFTDASIGATSWDWDFGDGSAHSTAANPVHTYATAGNYIVKLIVQNNVFGCSDNISKTIIINTTPLDFQASKTKACLGDELEFTTAFMRPGNTSFSWLIDTNAATPFSADYKYKYTFATKGKHDIAIIAQYGAGCLDTLWKRGYVNVSQPEVHFYANPPQGCVPFKAKFFDTSINVAGVSTASQTWTFDGSSVVTGTYPTVNFTYNTAGIYTVKLEVYDDQGCYSSLERQQYITVNDPKAVFFAADTLVCRGESLTFNSSSTGKGLSYSWDFGDGSALGTGANPVHKYTSVGKYDIGLMVIDTIGCTSSQTKANYVFVSAPSASFTQSASLAICPPLTIQFTNNSLRADSSSWLFDNGGGPISVTNPIYTFSNPKLYNITLIVYDTNRCADTAHSVVRVLGYNGAFTYTPTKGCAPLSVNFQPPANGIPKITWDFNDGSTVVTNGTGVTHVYTGTGVYLPNVIFSDGASCKASSIGTDSIYVDKVTADFSWSTPCVGTPFTLSDHSSALFEPASSWFWLFGGADTAIGPNPNYNFSTSGNHNVTLIASNAIGCKDTITKPVFINPLPNIQTSPDKGLCPGDSTIITVTGGRTYTWSPAALVSCVNCDATKVYARDSSTTYYVVGIDDNGCVNRDSVRVFIQYITTVNTIPGGEICIGDTFRLAASGADFYQWSPAESLDSPMIDSPLAKPTTSTTYLLISKEGTCNVDSTYVHVKVNPLPVFSAGTDEIMARGTSVILRPTKNGIVTIKWVKDTTLSCDDCFLPSAHPRYTHTYFATGTDANGCSATDSVTVFVRCNGSLVFIPNTFSPNGDGNNDVFFPRGEGVDNMMSFRVFNRWGQLIFERLNTALNDESAGWDGTYKGQKLPPDVYVYTMQSRCEDGEVVKWRGDITLLK